MDTLQLLETEREIKLNIGGCIGIMSKFLVIVETIVFCAHSEVHMPFHTGFLPVFEELHLSSRPAEELHLHLLELPHTEDELTGYNLISECLSYLGDTERNLHTAGFLDIEILHENTLCGLRTEINLVVSVTGIAYLGAEHKVELTHISPVGSS